MKPKSERATKLRLEDIPAVNTGERALLLRMTTLDSYNNKLREGIPGFSEDELVAIKSKFSKPKSDGMRMEDIQEELRVKGWHVKPNTIKHYIQADQLPRPKEARTKTEKGAISIYPSNFLRHLNFVRFWLNAGRKTFEEIKDSMWADLVKTEFDRLEEHTSDDCYQDYDDGFIHAFYCGLADIENGLYYGKEAIKSAFSTYKEKKAKHLNKLKEIEHLADKLEKTIREYEREARKLSIYEEIKSITMKKGKGK